jgi:hypothetical protein
MAQEHYPEAGRIWERVVSIQETNNGTFHASLLPTLEALAEAYQKQGKDQDAIRIGRRIEAVAEMSGKHEH